MSTPALPAGYKFADEDEEAPPLPKGYSFAEAPPTPPGQADADLQPGQEGYRAPKAAPEVEAAIAGVPRPGIPKELEPEPAPAPQTPFTTNPRTGQRVPFQPVGSVPILDAPIVGAPEMVRGAERYTGTFTHPEQYGTEAEASEARKQAGSEVLQGAMGVSAPLFAATGLTAPIEMAKGLAVGKVSSEAAGKVAKALGGTPATQQLAKDVFWFLGPAAATAAAAKVESGAAGRYRTARTDLAEALTEHAARQQGANPNDILEAGPARQAAEQFMEQQGVPGPEPETGLIGTARNIRATGKMAEATGRVRAGQAIVPQTPPPAASAVNEGSQAMVRAQQSEVTAAQAVAGVPPPPPPAAPASEPPPMVTDQIAKGVGEAIKSLPPEDQPAAILTATHQAAASIAHHGGAVVNGETIPVQKGDTKAALKVAQKVINGQIAQADQEAKKPPETVSPSPTTKPEEKAAPAASAPGAQAAVESKPMPPEKGAGEESAQTQYLTPAGASYFHGTNNAEAIRKGGFSLSRGAKRGSEMLGDNYVEGVYLAKNRAAFEEGGNMEGLVSDVLPTSVREGLRIKKVDGPAGIIKLRKQYGIGELDPKASEKLTAALKKHDYDGLDIGDEVVIFDPKKVQPSEPSPAPAKGAEPKSDLSTKSVEVQSLAARAARGEKLEPRDYALLKRAGVEVPRSTKTEQPAENVPVKQNTPQPGSPEYEQLRARLAELEGKPAFQKGQTVRLSDGRTGVYQGGPSKESPLVPHRVEINGKTERFKKAEWAKLKPEGVSNRPVRVQPQAAAPEGRRIAGVEGRQTSLSTPTQERPAKYRLVESGSLTPSHNPLTFAKNARYPEGVQERSYDTSKEAQNRVIQQAQNYKPSYTVNTNPDAVNGPPVITPDGIVLGGNSRAMATARMYEYGSGDAYRQYLKDNAAAFGLKPEDVEGMKRPVLVREVEAPRDIEQMRRLGSELNKSMTGALGVSERAVSAGKSIKPESLADISAMVNAIGDGATLRDVMRERGPELVRMLVGDGVITDRERPQFVDTATGGLSEEGKTFVERALLGSVVDDPVLMERLPKSILNKIDGSLADLSQLGARTDEYNLIPLLRDAMAEHAEIAQRGTTVDLHLAQSGMFGPSRNAAVDVLVRSLAAKPKELRAALRAFAQDANFDVPGQATLSLGEKPTPVGAFNAAFHANLSEREYVDSLLDVLQRNAQTGGTLTEGIGRGSATRQEKAGTVQTAEGVQGQPATESPRSLAGGNAEAGTGRSIPSEPAETVNPASVKLLVTQAEQSKLRALGYTEEQIAHMKPEEAAELAKGEPTTMGMTVPGAAEAAEAVAHAAEPVKNWLGNKIERVQQAKEINEGLADLESQYNADVLRAVQMMKEVPGTARDEEALYHHLENPAEPVTAEQRQILDQWIQPFMDEAQRIYTKLTEGGTPIPGYVHRVVQDRGSLIERILAGSKGTGRGNVLSKYAPATKGRTMMAVTDANGERTVVSVKGGRVVSWENEQPVDLGGLRSGLTTKEGLLHERLAPINREIRKLQHERVVLNTVKGRVQGQQSVHGVEPTFRQRKRITEQIDKLERQRDAIVNSVAEDELKDQVFIDKSGRELKFTQATTKEIEANTGVRYYHNALASAITNYLNMRKAERAFDYIEDLKASPDFGSIAVKQDTGNPPSGWRPTSLPQLRGYYFEPHAADVLDRYASKLGRGGPTVFEQVGQFLRTSIFFNPLIHVPNISVHWAVERGVTGYMPWNWPRMVRAGFKAIAAVSKQNQDYLDALDVGAPLQYQRFENKQFSDLFFKKMAAELEGNPTTAEKVAKALGYADPTKLIKAIYNTSGKVTWWANDVAFLQSTYEKTSRGMDLKEALRETAKHIPDYRLPAHVMGSRGLANFMGNPNFTMFSQYHYGALRSYGEMLKDAVGPNVDPKQRAHAWDVMAMLALMTAVIYPYVIDKIAQRLTGDKNARVRRAGAATLPWNLYQVYKGEMTPTEALTATLTPAVHTKAAAELAFNRNLRTGRQIYNPHDSAKDIAAEIARGSGAESIAPISQATRIQEDRNAARKFGYGLLGVSFPLRGAEKVAQQIAQSKVGTEAMTPEDRKRAALRREVLEDAQKGNFDKLRQAVDAGAIDMQQARMIRRRANLDPLVARVWNFSYGEIKQVYDAATPEQQDKLYPLMMQKRARLLSRGKRAQVEQVESTAP